MSDCIFSKLKDSRIQNDLEKLKKWIKIIGVFKQNKQSVTDFVGNQSLSGREKD